MSNIKSMFEKLKSKAKLIKRDVAALFLACRRSDIPWYAKLFSLIVVGYALSPIDLIPDFIPVLGYLDDLILIPLGISIAIRLIPKTIMEECRNQAQNLFKRGKPKNIMAAVVIILIWILILSAFAIKLAGLFSFSI